VVFNPYIHMLYINNKYNISNKKITNYLTTAK